jgi:acyl-[acyl carrier protein]--UDP-N-acetylglucosamine O-acyltransferase
MIVNAKIEKNVSVERSISIEKNVSVEKNVNVKPLTLTLSHKERGQKSKKNILEKLFIILSQNLKMRQKRVHIWLNLKKNE